ncbi:hypothetical protein Q3G72_021139 [Acer saccharum]|nr:hypothetical protein Q3G72_021139 [Acer saccharum]
MGFVLTVKFVRQINCPRKSCWQVLQQAFSGSIAYFINNVPSTLLAEPSPLHTTMIVEKCTVKLVDENKHMLCQATEPMSTFSKYGHMIDIVVLIVTGTLHERDVQELLEKCHPLGIFDRALEAGACWAPYFSECITSEDLDDMNIEIMRNTLYKAYLENFYKFCQKFGRGTQEIMSNLLAFEADRRAVNITINRFVLSWRSILLISPSFSKLSYGESQMLDKAFYEEEVKRLCLAFEQQRLREQEIRNLMWISECVAQNQKSRVHDSVVFIF